MRNKHTHRGHCQACGRRQALATDSRNLAKHGYQVARWGYFVGTCPGSDKLPLEFERTFTDSIIASLGENILLHDRLAAEYRDGKRFPETVVVGGHHEGRKWIEDEKPYAECEPYQQKRAVDAKVHHHEMQARFARSHSEFLTDLIKTVHGREPVAVKHKAPPRAVSAGDTFQLYDRTWTVKSIADWGRGRKYVRCSALVLEPGQRAEATIPLRTVRKAIGG